MLATVSAATLVGVRGHRVDVEVHVAPGLPSFSMVGLPDATCREARDRVRAAMVSSRLPWPQQRVTVNLAPAEVPKVGTALDLAIAVGLLAATDVIDVDVVRRHRFVAELGLDGSLRPVRGTVPLVAALRDDDATIVVAVDDAADAAVVPGVRVAAGANLAEVVGALQGESPWSDAGPVSSGLAIAPLEPDLADVRGQPLAVAALTVAAAGRHHLLLCGPPGAGKSMLASRLPGLLPDLDDDAALEVTAVRSAIDARPVGGLLRRPPFRAPHHGCTAVALIGGGSRSMRPGEISQANQGVLFCDELGEFPPSVLDALRQPLEEGVVRVSRARGSAVFPARFQLVAATNPCPCGPMSTGCHCSPAARFRYLRRLSGPLLDRFDLRIRVDRPDPTVLVSSAATGQECTSAAVAARVRDARARSVARGFRSNADVPDAALDDVAPLTAPASHVLERLVTDGSLSARGVGRLRRVARTISDLADHDGPLSVGEIGQALAFRVPVALDRAGAA